MPREVVEASVFWGGDLLAVKYFALGERVFFDDVPKTASVEVRTRVVDAAPKMPRNRWDLPLGALAITAACMNAMVAGSLAHDAPFGGHLEPVQSSHETLVIAEDRPVLDYSTGIGTVRVKEESFVIDHGDWERPVVDVLGDTGMIAMLAPYRGGDTTTFPWAPDPRIAIDDEASKFGMFHPDGWAQGGLTLSGTGEGGGGKGTGIALDKVHTEPAQAMGSGHGHLAGHTVGPICHLPIVAAISCTRMAPELIQRIVRSSLPRFRGCYADGLRSNPALAGRVVTKFVIARDGTVSAASDGGSDLPDEGVRACVQRAFMNLSFPENPDGGVATVTYPIVMSPEE